MMFTADPVDAPTAERIGLVNRVVPADALMDEAAALAAAARQVRADRPGAGQARAQPRLEIDLEEALDFEAQLQSIAGRSADHEEGVAAFVEKRPPRLHRRVTATTRKAIEDRLESCRNCSGSAMAS